ncbi:uncharacterized protein TRIADDRAFT_37002 [Trichoplax adhaerens]|uniref:Aminopeptidase n=1 Tax=Trichoplax adhaerens TaxID=10228 RepID=B3RHY3_TRIAD|nr:hypothetical protein TRIADDRAFT_37002 [Trichoplax adhaerens]EDV28943.1 hypothetical protein TRIADDRAFT_37002 [Trichoplax adhaerens]|eukprot:XP_002108145.1 hypothetical protein TRIADDRAFT_37002 [Trichoplax adhaerens]
MILLALFITAAARHHKSQTSSQKHGHSRVTPSPTLPFPYKSFRLPAYIRPNHYLIDLRPNYDQLTTAGNVSINVTSSKKSNFIILHKKHVNILDVKVSELNSKKDIKVIKTDEYHKYNFYYIKLEHYLQPNKGYLIHVRFTSQIKTKVLHGLYRSHYRAASGMTRYLYSTHLEATHAREIFPCFDEPAMKAIFTLTITSPPGYTAISNSEIHKKKVLQNNYTLNEFHPTPPMSTYLVALVVSDFKNLEGRTINNVRVRTWANPLMYKYTNYSLHVTMKVIPFYGKTFGVAYPLPKMDLVAIPEFAAGAMENWGLILYRETSMIYNKWVNTLRTKQWVTVVVAHELAHQWFGNLVTMKWWSDIWLNEGFAAFMEHVGTNHVAPEFQMMKQFLLRNFRRAQYADSLPTIHPLVSTATNSDQIESLFDSISYKKGSCLIRMVRDYLGIPNFNQGIRHYLSTYKYKNADHNNLWQALQWASHGKVNISSMMSTWALQPGYPVVTLGSHNNNGTATISQQRFLSVRKSKSGDYGSITASSLWHIPISFQTKNNRTGKFMLLKRADIFPWKNTDGWIKLNSNQIGYFTVNYNIQNWNSLTDQLKKDFLVFNDIDRYQLLGDTYMLARPGLLTIKVFLNMTTYLFKEKNYLPLYAGLYSLSVIKQAMSYNKIIHQKFEAYIYRLIRPQIQRLGWKHQASYLQSKLQHLILVYGVHYNDSTIKSYSLSAYHQWVYNNTRLPTKFRSLILSVAMKYGGQPAEKVMMDKYLHTSSSSMKRLYFAIMATSKDPTFLNKLLVMTLDPSKVRIEETVTYMSSVARNSVGSKLCWEFYKKHFQIIHKRYNSESFSLSHLMNSLTSRFNTEAQYKEVKDFYRVHNNVGVAKSTIPIILSKIRARIDWKILNEADVIQWANKHLT